VLMGGVDSCRPFPPPLANKLLHLRCSTLLVTVLCDRSACTVFLSPAPLRHGVGWDSRNEFDRPG